MMEPKRVTNQNRIDLSVRVGPLRLKNPVLVASGTFQFGEEYGRLYDVNALGGIVTKTATFHPRRGNPPVRVTETPAGMLNSIGLENKGLEGFVREILPVVRRWKTCRIVSISGKNVAEFGVLARTIDRAGGFDAFELNLSCPNVAEGGLDFSTKPELTEKTVRLVRRNTDRPVIAKLTPNVTDIRPIAEAALAGGAHAISLINTLKGMAVDWRRRRPVLSTVAGGLSGPAVKPVALHLVWQVAKTFRCPVIGIGGIMTAEDVMEFLAVGASAVQLGTVNFVEPMAGERIVKELPALLAESGVRRAAEYVGSLQVPALAPFPRAGL